MKRLPLFATTLLLAAPAWAQTPAANPVLPVGVVACALVKDLADYNTYTATAPAFAKDLLDRAACFISETPQPAVKIAEQSKDGTAYTRYKLLSGHKVWVANGAAPSK